MRHPFEVFLSIEYILCHHIVRCMSSCKNKGCVIFVLRAFITLLTRGQQQLWELERSFLRYTNIVADFGRFDTMTDVVFSTTKAGGCHPFVGCDWCQTRSIVFKMWRCFMNCNYSLVGDIVLFNTGRTLHGLVNKCIGWAYNRWMIPTCSYQQDTVVWQNVMLNNVHDCEECKCSKECFVSLFSTSMWWKQRDERSQQAVKTNWPAEFRQAKVHFYYIFISLV
jgi:hypothetical protein